MPSSPVLLRHTYSTITSAYLYAFTLPDTLWMLVAGGAFFAAFVPVVKDYYTDGDEEAPGRPTASSRPSSSFCLERRHPARLDFLLRGPCCSTSSRRGYLDYAELPGVARCTRCRWRCR